MEEEPELNVMYSHIISEETVSNDGKVVCLSIDDASRLRRDDSDSCDMLATAHDESAGLLENNSAPSLNRCCVKIEENRTREDEEEDEKRADFVSVLRGGVIATYPPPPPTDHQPPPSMHACGGVIAVAAADLPDTKECIEELCPVCGDKVSGYHYGLLTCESCKGFFKRTVQNKKVYTCVAERSCHIDKTQRKRCPYCRFQKCLDVGMKLEAVRADRMRGGRNKFGPMYKRDRARKLQMMRQRQMAVQTLRNSQYGIITTGGGDTPISFSYHQHHQQQHASSPSGMATSPFSSLNIKQEIQIPQVSSLTSSPDSSPSPVATVALGQTAVISCSASSVATAAVTSASVISGASLAATRQILQIVTSNTTSGSSSSSNGSQSIGPGPPPPPPLPPSSAGGGATVASAPPPPPSVATAPTCPSGAIIGNISSEDTKSLWGQSSAAASPSPHQVSSPKSFNFESVCGSGSGKIPPLIHDFVQGLDDREWQSSLFSLLQNQTYNQCEVDLFELMCKVLDQNLFSQVDWARNSVFFKDLKVDDQMKLLQHSWSDMLVLDHIHHRMHNDLPDETLLHNGQKFDLLSLGLLGVPELHEQFTQITHSLHDLEFDSRDYVCLKFLLLLNPDVRGLMNKRHMQEGHEQVRQALHEYCINVYPQIPDKFNKLMAVMPEIHEIATRGEEHLYHEHCIGGAPTQTLLMEMLHAKRKA